VTFEVTSYRGKWLSFPTYTAGYWLNFRCR